MNSLLLNCALLLALSGTSLCQFPQQQQAFVNSMGGEDRLGCVRDHACNVRGANLLGYYNISQEDLASTVKEVRWGQERN